ncbi:OsmC family peroxiredoxin [Streptomyces sp. NPDC054775]
MLATGSAYWNGSFHQGSGAISTASETVREAPYTFSSRFEGAPGASPEELMAAAHAGCYNHSLANIFHKNGLEVGTIRTTVQVDMGSDVVTPNIEGVRIFVEAQMPSVDADVFQQFAARAGRSCAISRALAVQIFVQATLLD